MVELTDLLREKVEALDLTIPVKDYNGNKLYLCRTLHLATLKVISDGAGNSYKVTDFLNNEWIDVQPIGAAPDPFTGSVVICPPVYFMSGTPSSFNSEYQQIDKRAKNKMPLLWLNENYEENEPGPGSSIEREVTPQVFFMDEANENRWTNEEQHRMVLQPMANLADWFYQSFKADRLWKRLMPVRKIARARFGVYIDFHGNDRKILNEFTSAVETRPALVRYKQTACNC